MKSQMNLLLSTILTDIGILWANGVLRGGMTVPIMLLLTPFIIITIPA